MASPGVTEHDATPAPLVVPVQVSLPSRVSVTGSPAIGAEVAELVSTPDTVVATEYSPVAALTLRVVGIGGGGLTVTVEETLDAR
jgi:hypothetical protein